MKTVLLAAPEPKGLKEPGRCLSGNYLVDTTVDLLSTASRLKDHSHDLVFLGINLIHGLQGVVEGRPGGIAVYPKLAEMPINILTLAEIRKNAIETIEKNYPEHVLAYHSRGISKTSAALGISCRQLHKLMAKCRIRKEHHKQQQPSAKSGTAGSETH